MLISVGNRKEMPTKSVWEESWRQVSKRLADSLGNFYDLYGPFSRSGFIAVAYALLP